MNAEGGTGKVMDMQVVLKSMEKEWGKVKDQEVESIKKEVGDVEKEMEEVEREMEEEMEENKAEVGLDNIVLTTYTVKKSSSRSEALMAFHERKRLENLKSKKLNSSGMVSKTLPVLTPVPLAQAPSDLLHLSTKGVHSPTSVELPPPSTLAPSPTSDIEEVQMEVSLSPPPWINSPLSDQDQDEEMEEKDEEVEAIMMKKYAAEGFLHSDSNDNIVSESGEGKQENGEEDVSLKRKREDENVDKVAVEEEDKTENEMEMKSIQAPTISTSWRQAIGSSE